MIVDRVAPDAIPHAGTLVSYVEELATGGPPLYAIRCRICVERYSDTGDSSYSMGRAGSVPMLTLDEVVGLMRAHWSALHRITPSAVACYFADGGFAWV